MRHVRRISAVALAVLAGTLMACGGGDADDATSGSSTQDGQRRVGVFIPQGNSYAKAMTDAAEQWAADNDAKVSVFDSGIDPQRQYAQIQDVIAQHSLDGMIFFPLNGPALAPLVKEADEAGIASVALYAPLSGDLESLDPKVPGLDGLVWTPPAQRGRWLAQQMAQACEGLDPCRVAYLSSSAGVSTEEALLDAYRAELEQYPNVETVAVLDRTGFTRNSGVKATQDLLSAHPDVNVIASGDQPLLGAEVALKQAGKTIGTGPGDVRIVGLGGTTDGVQRVKDGAWVSTQLAVPRGEMLAGLEILDEAMRGELKAPRGVDAVAESKYPPILTKPELARTSYEAEYTG